jgi:hypothetical protein
MPTLTGEELLKFLDTYNEQELKDNIAGVKQSFNSYNLDEAKRKFERVNEIIIEKYNREIEDYGKIEKKVNLLINFGKTYIKASEIALAGSIFDTVRNFSGSWKWLPYFLTANWLITNQIKNRIDKLKSEDIVTWWANKWPFHDPGITFTLWRHAIKNIA